MKIRKYWRLSTDALPQKAMVFNTPALEGPAELIARLSPRQGIVLARWNPASLLGQVSALGVVTKVGPTEVDWREVDITLRPNPSGRTHWANKPFFSFAKAVVARYMLDDLFAERFPDLEDMEFSSGRPSSVGRRLPTAVTPGYVYVIRSDYGFKIGKTVNLKSRTRLFEVKLPFPIQIEHYAWFDDYTAAERNFHEMFSAKRKEGEWFDLNAQDLARIKSVGIPNPH